MVDFGCGGGYLLSALECRERVGVEVNQTAHDTIAKNGVKPFSSIEQAMKQFGEEFADIIISNNVLEHTSDPIAEVKRLREALKTGGKAHFLVPCDSIHMKFDPADHNKHLFSFSPMNLGNLFESAGFVVDYVRPHIHKWPPGHRLIHKVFGQRVFNIASYIYGRLDRRWFQVEILATKA